jgi:hypothetical protein
MNKPAAEAKAVLSWRAILPVHAAAELFPLMNPDELCTLGKDIRRRGMVSPIIIWSPPDRDDKREFLLDGRNRLDAAAMVGLLAVDDDSGRLCLRTSDGLREIPRRHVGHGNLFDTDPYRLAISYNIHRRHLTAEQKCELIAKVLKAKPEASNRQIAKQVKADDKTVAKVRANLESRSEIPNVETRTDSKGQKQQAHKPPKPTDPAVAVAADLLLASGLYGTSLHEEAETAEQGKEDHVGNHLNALTKSWNEVAAQIVSGNRTRLKLALATHVRAVKLACAELKVGEVA